MPLVKFFKAGRWADRPYLPQIEVEDNQVVEVSDYLASVVIEAGRGELVLAAEEKNPAHEDKSLSEENPSVNDKKKAERKK